MVLSLCKVLKKICVLWLVSFSLGFAQQDPQFTQYSYNLNIINPAYAGSRGFMNLSAFGRAQWVGVDGAPNTATLSIDTPLGRKVGLGLSAIYDQIGNLKETTAYIDFSYTVFITDELKLALGIKGGTSFLDTFLVDTYEDGDPLNNEKHNVFPNIGAGIFLYNNYFYVGASAPNILESTHLEKDSGVVSTASENKHLFFIAGYVYDINNNVKLKTSTMIKTAIGAPTSMDLSVNALFNEKLEAGLSYRFGDSLSAIIGARITNKIKVGYAYDRTISNIGKYNSGTHEIMLIFSFYNSNFLSPRFF